MKKPEIKCNPVSRRYQQSHFIHTVVRQPGGLEKWAWLSVLLSLRVVDLHHPHTKVIVDQIEKHDQYRISTHVDQRVFDQAME